MNYIKHRLRAEPSGSVASDSLVCVSRILFIDNDRLLASRERSRLSHQLRMTALLERDEPEDSLQVSLADAVAS